MNGCMAGRYVQQTVEPESSGHHLPLWSTSFLEDLTYNDTENHGHHQTQLLETYVPRTLALNKMNSTLRLSVVY